MIERHQDYILQIDSLAAGASVQSLPLPLDTDAPFALRARGIHIAPPTSTRSQALVQQLRFRYKNAAGEYLSTIPVQTPQDFALAFGQKGQYRPVYPQQVYPPGGAIEVDLFNDSATDITNIQVIFRGVKLFRDGSIPAPTYPDSCRALDFTYQSGKGTSTDAPLILSTAGSLFQQPFNVKSDADFVCRAAQAGLWTTSGDGGLYSTNGYTELFIQLFDANFKSYSNLPIHIDWLMGNAGGTQLPGLTALGNSAPGLFFPEIYIPKNQALYFSLFRRDTPYVGVTDALPVRIAIAWVGSKVYAQ